MTQEPSADDTIRAPAGAVGWTARDGFVYDVADMPTRIEAGDYVLVVSSDGVDPRHHAVHHGAARRGAPDRR